MKIATWNIERLQHKSKLDTILQVLAALQADILVLTETDSRIELKHYQNMISSSNLFAINSDNYKSTENRISLYTNYEILNRLETYDKYTSLCVELKTPFGNLIVYGTIIGIYGNRHTHFKSDLSKQLLDYEKCSKMGNLCVIGDFNISFSDNYYFTNDGRNQLNHFFDKNKLTILTQESKNCIDHIAISTAFCEGFAKEIGEWNIDKKLSDHKGICVSLSPIVPV